MKKPKALAEMLSTYFAESWNRLVPPLCPEARHNSDVDPFSLDDLLCTEEEVCHLLENLNVSKAAGPDGISAQMLKETASVIAPSPSKLFNCSLSCWKLANVIPVPKPGSLNSSPSGYRPISFLSIISKVLEEPVYMFMYDYLSEHYPIASNQWGFQPGKSCTTTLLTTTCDWYKAMENGKDVATVLFDFWKALDSVPHEPLISKLHHTGLHHHIVKWVQCYLSNGSQRVVVNGSESDVVIVISGVPQGSVLGPLLFFIHVNDLCNITLSHGSKVTMYADDLVLYKVIDIEPALFSLQEDINNIVRWARSNLMTLNYSKCKIMLLFQSAADASKGYAQSGVTYGQVLKRSRSLRDSMHGPDLIQQSL